MEHTAVQLMSRKQRAAKLLTGDIGLTGLDATYEWRSGFEEALLDAIAKDESLLDPIRDVQGKRGTERDRRRRCRLLERRRLVRTSRKNVVTASMHLDHGAGRDRTRRCAVDCIDRVRCTAASKALPDRVE